MAPLSDRSRSPDRMAHRRQAHDDALRNQPDGRTMSRDAKGPRLWYRKAEPATASRAARAGGWVILDGGRQHRTGCGFGDREGAERALAHYLTQKHSEAPRRQRRLSDIPVADVLAIYARDVAPGLATAHKLAGRIERLLAWWGDMMLDEVTGNACRQYAKIKTPGAARRELQDLQAAINHHHREGLHREQVLCWLPPAGKARDRWLTRSEAARLIWACWRAREVQEGRPTDKRPLQHLARFILFSLHTMSRPGDVLNASFRVASDRSVIDLEHRLFFRLPASKAETKKRQPPVPIDASLAAHLARWEKHQDWAVEFYGRPVASIKTAWAKAIDLAGLGDNCPPYTLRHTAITWAMMRGEEIWKVAKFAGTSAQMIEAHYGHFHPDYLRGVGAMRRNETPGTKGEKMPKSETKRRDKST